MSQQLSDHGTKYELDEELQSAYKSKHSTETALIKIMNDILLETDSQNVVVMAFFNRLVGRFREADHNILLKTLCVEYKNLHSKSNTLECCVPQSSGLGPDLYCKYSLPL